MSSKCNKDSDSPSELVYYRGRPISELSRKELEDALFFAAKEMKRLRKQLRRNSRMNRKACMSPVCAKKTSKPVQ